MLALDVAVLSPDGAQRIWEEDSGSLGEPEVIGNRIARKLRERGAAALLEREIRGTRA
jgi:porphobilinogen deaminase